MGDFTEDMEAWAFIIEDDLEMFNGEHCDEIIALYNKGKLQWLTKDGDVIDVKDMDEAHIKNCVAWIKDKFPENFAALEWLDAFNMELAKRSTSIFNDIII